VLIFCFFFSGEEIPLPGQQQHTTLVELPYFDGDLFFEGEQSVFVLTELFNSRTEQT
jgi:hypothetical protein